MLVILTVGTAASGKSTWAKSAVLKYPGLRIAVIERDAIRMALHAAEYGTPFSWAAWNRVLETRGDTLNPLKRVSFLLNGTVHGHAPGSPHKHPAALDSVLRQDNTGRTDPVGGPCPGYYYAGDFPDVDT